MLIEVVYDVWGQFVFPLRKFITHGVHGRVEILTFEMYML